MDTVRLIVSIDTEEDNWVSTRANVTTRNIEELPALERRFESLGIRATYFTNYQVAIQRASADIIRGISDAGRSEVAAHLHPWNTPPYSKTFEETMLLNLPPALQAAKLATVTEALAELLGGRPSAFRAGRFGLGPSTVRALIDSGYKIDSSITPFVSWEQYDHGPSHVGAPLHMYRLDGNGDVRVPTAGPLVEVPLSCGYTRWDPASWPRIHSWQSRQSASRFRLTGLAARTGIVRPIILSPEIHDAVDMHALCRRLLAADVPFLHVFWHSPSMRPGLSPFSRTSREVDRLVARFERLLELLHRTADIRSLTVTEAVTELNPPHTIVSSATADLLTLAPSISSPPTLPVPAATPIVEADNSGAAAEAAPIGAMGRHTLVYLAGILVGRALSFVMLPFYTRQLTTADYGIMQLMEMTLDIIAIIAGARIASGIHRYYFLEKKDADRKGVVATAQTMMAVSFITFGALTGVLAEPLMTLVMGSSEHAGLLRISAVTFALQSLIIVPSAFIQLEKRSVLLTSLVTGKTLIQLTLNIILLAGFGLGLKAVFISTLVANIALGAVLAVMVLPRVGFGFSSRAARSLLRYGLPLVGTQFATFFITFGDRYFLRVSADLSSVGLYSLAYQFGFIVAAVGYVPFAMVWEPTRFQIAGHPNRDALYSRSFLFMNACLLIPTIFCALYVRDFIIVMSDPAYHTAYRIVPIILAAYVLQSWSQFQEVGILVKEKTEYVTLANWAAAVVALICYATLIPRWQGWGAAIATVVAFFVRFIVTYVASQRLLPVRYEWAPVWRLVILTTVFVVIGLVLPHPGVPMSLAMRTGLFVVYLWLFWHVGAIQEADKQRILAVVRAPYVTLRGMMA